jgi:superfamily II DNA or RNA helicase
MTIKINNNHYFHKGGSNINTEYNYNIDISSDSSDSHHKSDSKSKTESETKSETESETKSDSESETKSDSESETDKNDKVNGYPETDDENFQSKIYKKREYYYYKLPDRPDLSKYENIASYRKKICEPTGELLEQQALLSNFINPDTPYKGVLIFHGTGVGKTLAGLAIGEKFKQQVQRYGTQIYVLVPGPLLKEQWKEEFLKLGDTYLKKSDNYAYMNEEDKEKIKKQAILSALQYYKITSYTSFRKRVLGDRIIEEKKDGKTVFKKGQSGEFERDITRDRLTNLNNSLLIVDEAHNLTDNTNGEAVRKIIENSTNLKVVLLTATPMKNSADQIVELLNYLRPTNSPIIRDKIFNSQKNHLMDFKPNGLEYFKKMASGYVSHLRGADPLTFAQKIEMGEKPKGLLFTKITRCYMDKFQETTYNNAVRESIEEQDALDRKSEAVANFVFPGLDEKKENLIGLYGREGLNNFKNQIKTHKDKINKLVAKNILKLDKEPSETLVDYNELSKNITGNILKKDYLKFFSTKFHQALCDIEENLFVNQNTKNNEPRTGFCYSNLVKTGIEIFIEILTQNGFIEYDENPNNYNINDNTKCYFCGYSYKDHIEKNKILNNITEHKFSPAVFIKVTGSSSEDTAEAMPEDNKKILTKVFNNISNINGKNIKLVLGSRVMNEGISLKNVYTVQILDVYFNFGRVDQVIGRGIRYCSHYNLMNKDNVYPKVKVYKYAVSLNNTNELSTEEDLYQKAEAKYLLVKKVERAMKEVAIDCALNKSGNMFEEEIKEYDKCIKPDEDVDNLKNTELKDKDKFKNKELCPPKCDFMNCEYKCEDKILNNKYYDPDRKLYKRLKKENLDITTFNLNLARTEIEFAKKHIKELYMSDYVYNLDTILSHVKNSYPDSKKDLFDEFFVQKGLDELIPITENDFNNFKDIIHDKTHKPGYLIYVNGYYVFQPFDENEKSPMFYRTGFKTSNKSKLSLKNFILNEKSNIYTSDEDIENYNYIDVVDYYDNRDEYEIVGIIDKETDRKKSKRIDEIEDVFKIREKRDKILDKKRATGIPSVMGAVCATSKDRNYLLKIAKNLNIEIKDKYIIRNDLCGLIQNKLIELEKYSKGKNKKTYIMVPKNHPTLKFPLNLEDRIEFLKKSVNNIVGVSIEFSEIENKKEKNITLSFKNDKVSKNDENKIIDLGFSKNKNLFSVIIQ